VPDILPKHNRSSKSSVPQRAAEGGKSGVNERRANAIAGK
jgi:hypothetical protein